MRDMQKISWYQRTSDDLNEPFNVDELLETIKEHQFTRYPLLRMETKTILKVSSTLKNS